MLFLGKGEISTMRITFIGGGVMAEAMLRGIIDRDLAEASDIVASDISTERRSYLTEKYGVVTTSNNSSATSIDIKDI